MKNKICILFLVVTASLISGCIYSETGTYEVAPISDDPPVITVTTNLDTLYNPSVNDSLEISYYISIQNGDLYLVDAVVGDVEVYSSDTTQGLFTIYPYYVQEPGVDTLYFDVYYSSNTNSLADIVGYEASVIKKTFAIDFNWGMK